MNNRVLFISGRCPHSKKILLGIQQHIFLKSIFQIVNIDVTPFPNYIKSVPCILVSNKVISGNNVFEYLGKIVDSKLAQEKREKQGTMSSQDQGVCKINDEGELEGYCGGGGMSIGFSDITEENDNYKTSRHQINTNYDFLDGSDNSNAVYQQVKQMEAGDDMLSQKRKSFDSDYEKLQAERGELMGAGRHGPNNPLPGMR
uniref:Glutaredoxin domain-containing protein n=1 Tax=viral metagenome TaxID=1070528 RepID=A0A6C0F7D6_9ZZZZ|tara:strand:- start:4604 stop:5206 length:603 start_codon:yes stop_codon:yes gene_type:complete